MKKISLLFTSLLLVLGLSSCGPTPTPPGPSEPIVLSSPSLSIEGSVASWDNIEHADHYLLSINSNDTVVNALSFDLVSQGSISQPGTYAIKVKAVAPTSGTYLDSAYSPVVNFVYHEKLATPTIYEMEDFIRWDSIEGADSYDIYIDNEVRDNVTTNRWELVLPAYGAIYEISVKAKSSIAPSSDMSNILECVTHQRLDYKVSITVNFAHTSKPSWAIVYAYTMDDVGDIKCYAMEDKGNNVFEYEDRNRVGAYHTSFYLGTEANRQEVISDSGATGVSYYLSPDESTQFSFNVSFASDPHEPTQYADRYNGYYSSITSWTDGEDLMSQLSTLMNNTAQLVSFDDSTYKWDVNRKADEVIDNFDRVNVVYGYYEPLKVYTNAAGNFGWQREHAFCQSLGGFRASDKLFDDATAESMRSDWHNLFASDGKANNARGNKNLGEIDPSWGEEIIDVVDSYGEVTDCQYVRGVEVFEPENDSKGALARAILYMCVRFPQLSIIEGPASTGSASHGMKSDIINWALSREVSESEYKHNLGVFSYQKNRNPFVDFPGLVDYVFGDNVDVGGQLKYIQPSYDTVVGSNPTSVREMAIEQNPKLTSSVQDITYKVGEKFMYDDLSFYFVNNDFSYSLANKELFTSNIEDGYQFIADDIGIIRVSFQTIQQTPLLSSHYDIKVIDADPVDQCNYNHVVTGKAAGGDFNSCYSNNGVVNNVTLSSRVWQVYWQNGAVGNGPSTSTKGAQFGTTAAPCTKVYFETNSFADDDLLIERVFIGADTASGVTYTANFYVNERLLGTKNLTYNNGTALNYGFILNTPVKGKIKIEITGLTKAVYIKRLAVNAISEA